MDGPEEGVELSEADYAAKVLEALNTDLSKQADQENEAKEKAVECWACGNAVKYRCPRCYEASCSMECVKRHKSETGCSGMRDRTAFVRLSEFTDAQLQSDFTFLEDAHRVSDNAKRDGKGKKVQRDLPKKVNILLRNVPKRGINLRLMPAGMQRRRENQSYYDIGKDLFSWTTHWHFSGCSHIIKENAVPETTTIRSSLTKHLGGGVGENAVLKAQLRPYFDAELDSLSVFMKVEGRPGSIRYRKIPLDSTIKEALQDTELVEFPVFFVATSSEIRKFKGLDEESSSESEEEESSEESSSEESDSSSEEEESSEEELTEGEEEGEICPRKKVRPADDEPETEPRKKVKIKEVDSNEDINMKDEEMIEGGGEGNEGKGEGKDLAEVTVKVERVDTGLKIYE